MPIAAGISAVASIGSSLIGANAATTASNKQIDAQKQVLAMLQSTIGPILDTGKGITQSALGPLTALLTPGANMTDTLSKIPGFTFAQDWGQKAVTNLGTTMGLGGNTLAAGANYATGLASNTYGQIVNALQGFLNSGLTTETNAANALAGGSQSAISGIGNAGAAGTLGSANALSTGLGGLSNAGLLYGLGQRFGGASGGSIYGNPGTAGGFPDPLGMPGA